MMEYFPEDKRPPCHPTPQGHPRTRHHGRPRRPHYGYSLIRALADRSSLTLKEGTVYPILARLDRDGLVSSQWVESAQGPPPANTTNSPPPAAPSSPNSAPNFCPWFPSSNLNNTAQRKNMNTCPESVSKVVNDYTQRLQLHLQRVPPQEASEFLKARTVRGVPQHVEELPCRL
ncbi:MAG: helix-turn-helix transcriptional regulator [Acidobacteria bacterium]|nr:helix-turn-helix transcriptional regulator [Acidobacteriota bacterium]